MADIGGQKTMNKLKQSIVYLKNEIKEYTLNEAIISNALYSNNNMKKGKHHLFDELETDKMINSSNFDIEHEFE